MIRLIVSRIAQMLLMMAAVSFILFAIFDSDRFRKQIAVSELGGLAVSALSEKDYQSWLERKGLNAPVYKRYANWAAGLLRGDLGHSLEKDRPVGELVGEHLTRTALLALFVFLFMIPLSLCLGVLAGMRAGSSTDATISGISVVTTSIPEIATAIFLTAIFALGLGWLPAKSAMHDGFEFSKIVLPVLTLLIFDFGYVTRMTRASMAEVMKSRIYPHRHPEGIAPYPYRRAPCPAKRPDRSVYGHHPAIELDRFRGRGRRNVLSVWRDRKAAG